MVANFGTESLLGSIWRVMDSFSVRERVLHMEAKTLSIIKRGGLGISRVKKEDGSLMIHREERPCIKGCRGLVVIIKIW